MRMPIRSIVGIVGAVALAACATGETDDWGDGTWKSPTEPVDTESPPEEAEEAGPRLAPNLAVSGVAVFQGVKVAIVEEGKWVAERNAPVIASRPALVRVYVTPKSGWAEKSVTAELRLTTGGKELAPLKDTKQITAESKESDPKSTFNFTVAADSIAPNTTFQVNLTVADADVVTSGENDARFPRDGTPKNLDAKASVPLNIVIVPVKYTSDGSNRLPVTTEAQIAKLKQTMLTRYPTSAVEISMHAPFTWDKPVVAGGGGWDALLSEMIGLRMRDDAAKDVYYFGLFSPAESRATYCSYGSCVAGLSPLASDGNASMRAAIGLGYEGQEAADTMAHEIGHAHGRAHAPCGNPASIDEKYPYEGGTIGVWGYDIVLKKLISPSKGRDMMGYCENEWVSDYTFAALFKRMTSIQTEESRFTRDPYAHARTYRIARAAADGTLTWTTQVTVDREPSGGEEREATYTTNLGSVAATARARFYRFDHVPGGMLMLPEDVMPTTVSGYAAKFAPWSRVSVSGFKTSLTR